MSVNIIWTNKALKQLKRLDSCYRKSILEKVQVLGTFPAVEADIKKLAGRSNSYRLRIGDYRLIFVWYKDQEPQIIEIQQVSSRQSAY